MSDDLTHYELLEVDPDAPKDEIRTAYQAKLANVRAARDKEEETKKPSETVIRAAREEEARLRAAWQVLSDPVQRQRYDDKFYVSAEDGDGDGTSADADADADVEDPDTALVPAERTPARAERLPAQVSDEPLEIPSTGRRMTAAVVDVITMLAIWAVVYAITLAAGVKSGYPIFAAEVGTMEFLVLVYLILPTAWTGQTLGKRYTYCMVVDRATGQLPTTGQAIRRYIIPAFAFALLSTTGAVIGLIYGMSFLMNRDQISLADRFARTAVVIARYKPERLT
jgi:uncharacterized RDD family membrane protein YckC